MPRKRDFTAIIERLIHVGWTIKWMARESNYSAWAIRKVRGGKGEPPYGLGVWLIDLESKAERAGLTEYWLAGKRNGCAIKRPPRLYMRRGYRHGDVQVVPTDTSSVDIGFYLDALEASGLQPCAIGRYVGTSDSQIYDWKLHRTASAGMRERMRDLYRRMDNAGLIPPHKSRESAHCESTHMYFLGVSL